MNIGACWIKEKDGKKFFSGQIQVPGLTLNFAIFKNDKKEAGSNQPDYNIVWSPPKKDSGTGTAGAGTSGKTGEESPFNDDDLGF